MPASTQELVDATMTTPRRSARLALGLAFAWLPVCLGRDVVPAAAALASLGEAPQAFVPAASPAFLVLALLVIASACALVLSPGLLLALALDAGGSVGRWVTAGLALSLLVVSAAASAVQSLLGRPLRGGAFVAVVLGCALLAGLALALRLRLGRRPAWPLAQPHAIATLVSIAGVPTLLGIALLPKLLWESFNGDGAHAFESARLLLVQPLPFWPAEAGDIAAFPGVSSMLFAFPASWFVRLFGEIEVSVRLPFLLHWGVLYAALLALGEHGRRAPLGAPRQALLWLGLTVYAVTLAYSATYSPYFADIALPATQDTLLMVCFAGFALACARREPGWIVLFGALTYVSLPSGVMLLALAIAAEIVLGAPRPRRALAAAALALVGSVGLGALAPALLGALDLPAPGREYGVLGLLQRFAFLQWSDVSRVAFAAVPCGIAPALALLAWPRLDRLARALALVTLGYFALFYVQAHVSLHHFVPAMVLPLAMFLRLEPPAGRGAQHVLHAGAGALGALALWLSLPTQAAPHVHPRRVGAAIEDRLGGYAQVAPAALRRATLLRHLVPYAWDPRVPEESYGGSPLVWYHYAHRQRLGVPVNYVMQAAREPAPEAMRRIAEEDGVALYVRSERVWRAHLALRPPAPAGSPLYRIPRGILFRSETPPDGARIVSVLDVLARLGVDTGALLERLGVEPAP